MVIRLIGLLVLVGLLAGCASDRPPVRGDAKIASSIKRPEAKRPPDGSVKTKPSEWRPGMRISR